MQDRYQPTKLCLKTRYSSYMRLPKRKKRRADYKQKIGNNAQADKKKSI